MDKSTESAGPMAVDAPRSSASQIVPAPTPSALVEASPRALPESAARGLLDLEWAVGGRLPELVRDLVAFTFSRDAREDMRVSRPRGIFHSVINRRRRAARLWLNAILEGSVHQSTLYALTHSWGPQLAGTGPEVERALPALRDCVLFLRGMMTGMILDRCHENLVPQARALHALEAVLELHLRGLERPQG